MARVDPNFPILDLLHEGGTVSGWSHRYRSDDHGYWLEEWLHNGRVVYEEGENDLIGVYAIDYTAREAWIRGRPDNVARDWISTWADDVYFVDNPLLVNSL